MYFSGGWGSVSDSSFLYVDLIPCLLCCMCTIAVDVEKGRFFFTSFTVSSVYMIKWPHWVELIYVLTNGMKQAAY